MPSPPGVGMNLVDVIVLLVVLQYLAFVGLVGRARGRYGIQAPATSGAEEFERAYRVQMNTLELMVALLPALWLAAKYWPAAFVAAVGAVDLLGRLLYWRAYRPIPRAGSWALS